MRMNRAIQKMRASARPYVALAEGFVPMVNLLIRSGLFPYKQKSVSSYPCKTITQALGKGKIPSRIGRMVDLCN